MIPDGAVFFLIRLWFLDMVDFLDTLVALE